VVKYVENPNSIILAVSKANDDFSNSESVKIAKEFDPEGIRTLAVLTKLDLSESIPATTNILKGNSGLKDFKMGIIGVINSNTDTDKEEKSIEQQFKDEKIKLAKDFPEVAKKNGIPFLENSLSKLLIGHIQNVLPKLRDQISQNLKENKEILAACGDKVQDKSRVLSKILTKFVKDFEYILEEGSHNVKKDPNNKLIGGPKIRNIFDDKFSKEIKEIVPQISKDAIIEYIQQTGGPRASLFAPEKPFKDIVLKQIERLRSPSLECAENVKKEMENVIKFCVEAQPEIIRFPKLMRKISDIMLKLMNDTKFPETSKHIEHNINYELSSINTNHPDFSIQEALKNYYEMNKNNK
jgi:dynamin 1-like protein